MRQWVAVVLAGCVTLITGCAPDAQPRDTAATRTESATIVADDSVVLVGELLLATQRPRADIDAVIIVGGSGGQDRDGSRAELPGYRPLYEIAHAVAAVGVSSLRLDERGVGASGGRPGATTSRTVADVQSAMRWMRARYPHARIGMIGHSEGGLVALMAAAADTSVRALVLLATPSRTGREIARWQRAWVTMRDVARFPASTREQSLLKAEASAEQLAARDPWMREWFALDPTEFAPRARGRALVVHGDRDYQVPVAQARELASALERGGVRVDVQLFPNVNHLLLVDRDGDPDGYVRIVDRRVAQVVVAEIVRWLQTSADTN